MKRKTGSFPFTMTILLTLAALGACKKKLPESASLSLLEVDQAVFPACVDVTDMAGVIECNTALLGAEGNANQPPHGIGALVAALGRDPTASVACTASAASDQRALKVTTAPGVELQDYRCFLFLDGEKLILSYNLIEGTGTFNGRPLDRNRFEMGQLLASPNGITGLALADLDVQLPTPNLGVMVQNSGACSECHPHVHASVAIRAVGAPKAVAAGIPQGGAAQVQGNPQPEFGGQQGGQPQPGFPQQAPQAGAGGGFGNGAAGAALQAPMADLFEARPIWLLGRSDQPSPHLVPANRLPATLAPLEQALCARQGGNAESCARIKATLAVRLRHQGAPR